MRTIHLLSSIANKATGPSYAVARLCESLIERGQEVTLATLALEKMRLPPEFLKTFPVGFGPRRLGVSPALKYWLNEQARTNKVDILHSHSLWMMHNVYPGWVAQQYRVPYVFSPHGTFTRYAMATGSRVKLLFWPLVQRPALTSVSCFHATALSEYEDIRRLGFKQPVAVIPNGIDVPVEKSNIASSTRKTLLFLGRIHPEKGIDNLIRAWNCVYQRFPQWRLNIVGPNHGGYLEKMQNLSQRLGVERCTFSPPLYGAEKFDAYREAELFVLPSPSENFGNTIAEALSVGTPVITTKGAPWAELETKQAGWWIEIGVEPLVSCLNSAFSKSSNELNEMGTRGRAWMIQDFKWRDISHDMDSTYRWLLAGAAKPRCVIAE
jgi:glycosyltransferase involved in cell wall biosynthesis